MPTYEYECLECGANFEAFQKMSDDVIKECPQCQGSLRRLISSGAGVIFKGSGFYATDYKNKDKLPKETKSTTEDACSGCDQSACQQRKK